MKLDTASLAKASRKIKALDLEAVKFKLSREVAKEWSEARLEKAEEGYRRFLFLCYAYPDEMFIPTADIDEVWHCHILDTRAYLRDCVSLFGELLHHWPYAGLNGVEDHREFQANFQKTRDLYAREFGEEYGGGAGARSCGSSCGRSCDGGGHVHALRERERPRIGNSAARVFS